MIRFEAEPFLLNSWIILRLPEAASAKLPSRGQVMITGTMNDVPFQTPLEPDGRWSHWFRIDGDLAKAVRAQAGDTLRFQIKPVKTWPEPDVPADWQKALAADAEARGLWERITPMARWEWIRWMRATSRQETRQRRIEVGISKLKSGERRPCCWNRNLCTEPAVSKNGVLLEPGQAA